MQNFPYFFPFIFIGTWLLAMFIISKTGWSKFAAEYKTMDAIDGTTISLASAGIGKANYNNALTLKYNSEGLYLKPMFLFRAFHPPLFIPWKDIVEVKHKKILFTSFKELSVGDPLITTIKLRIPTFEKMESTYMQAISKPKRY